MQQPLVLRCGIAPFSIALLLSVLVVLAPIVNAKGRPPRAVFHVLPDTVQVPTLHINASHLGDGRYMLMLNATDFVFTDLCVADAEAVPVGHAHVHVDGEKVASAFMPQLVIGPLAPGQHAVDVVLRAQDHRPIIAAGKLVQAQLQLSVPDQS